MTIPRGLTERPIAHRGLWRAGERPENSLAAFHAACTAGYGVELDARLTADGDAVVFHDDGLERVTAQSGLVEERTLDELTALTLFGGGRQAIPPLSAALTTIAGRQWVLVELKVPIGQEGPLEARAAEALEAYDGPAAVLSFNVQSLAFLARRYPGIPRGLNANSPPSAQALDLAQPDFFSLNKAVFDFPEVQSWRATGRVAIAWTVRSPQEKIRLDGLADNFMFEGFAP